MLYDILKVILYQTIVNIIFRNSYLIPWKLKLPVSLIQL